MVSNQHGKKQKNASTAAKPPQLLLIKILIENAFLGKVVDFLKKKKLNFSIRYYLRLNNVWGSSIRTFTFWLRGKIALF